MESRESSEPTVRDYLATRASEEDIRFVVQLDAEWNVREFLGIPELDAQQRYVPLPQRWRLIARARARYVVADEMLAARDSKATVTP